LKFQVFSFKFSAPVRVWKGKKLQIFTPKDAKKSANPPDQAQSLFHPKSKIQNSSILARAKPGPCTGAPSRLAHSILVPSFRSSVSAPISR
jgi:hypothetical protein